jgi:hypothetical protein
MQKIYRYITAAAAGDRQKTARKKSEKRNVE